MLALLALEQSLVITLNQFALSSGFLLFATRMVAVYAIFIIIGFYAISVFVDWQFIRVSSKLFFIQGLIAGSATWIFNQLVGFAYFRDRPHVAIEKVQSIIGETLTGKSFPSDHTTVAFALAMTLFLWSPKVGIWFLVIALLIGVARVIAGVHYPTDVLGGIIVGVFFAWVIHKLFT